MNLLLNRLRRYLLRILRDTPVITLKAGFPHSVLVSRATYSPWYADTAFMATYTAVRANTLVDIYRCHELWSLLAQLTQVLGDVLEVGVWRGGTGCLLARRVKELGQARQVFLCDTFSGVVKASPRDTLYQGGEHADTTREAVDALAARLDVVDQVCIVPGVFPDESGPAVDGRRFAFCHIDVDAYLSARDIFAWVAPRLSRLGMVVFDDYGFHGCEGVTTLVNELAHTPGFLCLTNLNGHALLLKTED